MPRKAAPAPDADDAPLKRLGGGRWQTRDERFTIEPQSGTWVVVDAEQTDDLGLPLVRGPYRSLTDAKAAISTARTSAPAESPLATSIERRRERAAIVVAAATDGHPGAPARPTRSTVTHPERAGRKAEKAEKAEERGQRAATGPETPTEPAWLADLGGAERGRARRLIERLEGLGVADATSVVRRDVVGDVPAVAAVVIGRRLDALSANAPVDEVVELLADGRDADLGVRWRLVDGDGRPILLDRVRHGRRVREVR